MQHNFAAAILAQRELAAVDRRRHDDAQRVGRGVEPGDALTAINGRPIKPGEDLRTAIRARKVGDSIVLQGRRGDKTMEWEVTIREMPPPEAFYR